MKTVEMLLDFKPGPKSYQRGEIVPMEDASADFLVRLGKARLHVEESGDPKRRQYERRDLRAKD
jgi:hypothetical protein